MRAQLLAVESLGQLAQHRVGRVGRDALDQELLLGDSDGKDFTFPEQVCQAVQHRLERRGQQRVALRIGRVLVEGDGKLDEKDRQLPRQNLAFVGGGRAIHRRKRADRLLT